MTESGETQRRESKILRYREEASDRDTDTSRTYTYTHTRLHLGTLSGRVYALAKACKHLADAIVLDAVRPELAVDPQDEQLWR